MKVILAKGFSVSLLLLVGMLILFSILINTLRLSGPLGDSFTAEIEYQVGQIVGRKVDIGSVEFTINGITPSVHLTELTIYRQDEVSPALEFDEMEITLDSLRTIANIQLTPTYIVLRGSSVEVKRTIEGKLTLSGFNIEPAEKTTGDENLLDIFQSLTFEAEDIKIFWDDEPFGLSYQFIAQNLNIKKDEKSFSMRGVVALPETIGSEIDLAVKIVGNVEDYKHWNGDFYLNTEGVQLQNLPFNLFTNVPYVITSGSAGLEAWGKWVAGDVEVSGDIKLLETIVSQKPGQDQQRFYATRLDSFESRFNLSKSQSNWLITADQINAAISGEEALLSELAIELQTSQQDEVYRGAFDQLNVVTLVSLAQVVQPVNFQFNKVLDQLKPSGVISNLSFEYQPGELKQVAAKEVVDSIVEDNAASSSDGKPEFSNQPEFSVTANIKDLILHAGGKVPGIDSLDGTVKLTEKGGEVSLTSNKLAFDYPFVFYQPLVFDQFNSTVEWQSNPGYVDLVIKELNVTNQEGKANGFGVIRLSQGHEGFMDIEVMSDKLDLQRFHLYLPRILPDKTEKWLRAALIGGEAEAISFSYRGSMDKYAYKNGDAKLAAEFAVKDIGIHYQDNWPDVDNAAGLVKFAERGISIKLSDGETFDNKVTSGLVSIQDFYKPVLNIQLKTLGKTSGGLAYLQNSPPGKNLKAFLQTVKATGNSKLELSVSLPLTKKLLTAYSLNGEVVLDNNQLALPDKNLSFESVNGIFNFTKNTYSAKGIQAFFRGKPVTANVSTRVGEAVMVEVTGRMGLENLLPDNLLLQNIIKGESVWKTRTTIPLRARSEKGNNKATAKTTVRPIIELNSDLVGSSIDLPMPLAKSQGVIRPIQVRIDTKGKSQDVSFNLGQTFTGRLKLVTVDQTNKAGTMKLARAAFHFGSEIPVLPDKNIQLTGKIKLFDLSAWISRFPDLPLGGADGNGMSLFNADISVEDISFTNQNFHTTQVKVANTDTYWRVNLNGDDISGYIRFPRNLANDFKLTAELDHLKLASASQNESQDGSQKLADEGGQKQSVKPSQIPAIDAVINKFFWNNQELGKLELQTTVNTLGQDINKLTLESATTDFDVTGNWYETATGGQLTSLAYRLSGTNLGGLFHDLDITDNLSETEGEITGESSWFGQPVPIDFATLKGVMNATLHNGRFTQIKSGGFSRFFSTINLDNLPKNLSRNFKDVAGTGYFFDDLYANIEIVNGNVFLNDVGVESASAKISFSGSTDLVNKQHNIILGVVPKLSSSVPLAAGLVAGPQTAALIYLLDKIASSAGLDINKSLVLPYEIKGDWESPEVIELFSTIDDVSEGSSIQYQ